MKFQLIKDFLNLPGIVGIALMDGQSRFYAYGLPYNCNLHQRQLFTQGLQQILETTPAHLDCFNFHFRDQQIFLYKVEPEITLLVMTQKVLPEEYPKSIAQLRHFLKTDFEAVANMLIQSISPIVAFVNGVEVDLTPAPEPTYATPLAPPSSAMVSNLTTVDEILGAMNRLSAFTTQYLGKFIVANHWRSQRPNELWLNQFQITSTGSVMIAEDSELLPSDGVNLQQLTLIQTWTVGFSQRCAKVIRDYPTLVQSQALDQREWELLFADNYPLT